MILCVDFSEISQSIDLALAEQLDALDMQFDQVMEVKADANPYTGDYSVVPSVDGETLQTKDKYMVKDVTIKPIPYYNVGNTAGGTTVYIGKEV